MYSSNLAPGEYYVQCPYNKAHMIMNRRLVTHYVKCRKQYEKEMKQTGKSPEIVECRFNYSHRVYKPEIELHERECPDQYSVIHAMAGKAQIAPVQKQTPNDSGATPNDDDEEDWDKCLGAGYDPMGKIADGGYIYQTQGLTKSERKAEREEKRRLWRKINDEECQKESVPGSSGLRPMVPSSQSSLRLQPNDFDWTPDNFD